MSTLTTKLLAATLIAAGLAGATSSAFADEYITAKNKEFYAVAAGQQDSQAKLPANAAPMSNENSFNAPAGSLAPATGPFSDQAPHSGPSQNG
ncbi:hypothetical protein [Azorhizobium doebereinerae]|uniref:hypothetical protein n=1 Tax=Azorhizobium doebereinerae TaxID=281091 RepID=UPI00040FF245|nr:hypothetical protein [Azorhizobium doebereinerae]